MCVCVRTCELPKMHDDGNVDYHFKKAWCHESNQRFSWGMCVHGPQLLSKLCVCVNVLMKKCPFYYSQ